MTTSTTTSTGTTSTATTTSSTGVPPTLTDVAVAITYHTQAQLTAYSSIGCLFCHGTGTSNAFPTAGTWNATANGSTDLSGTYTVVAGSKADHTGYTNATNCEQSGCHAAPTS
jgi:hypothetical protein